MNITASETVIDESAHRRAVRQFGYHVLALCLAAGYALATGAVPFGH